MRVGKDKHGFNADAAVATLAAEAASVSVNITRIITASDSCK